MRSSSDDVTHAGFVANLDHGVAVAAEDDLVAVGAVVLRLTTQRHVRVAAALHCKLDDAEGRHEPHEVVQLRAARVRRANDVLLV